MSASLVGSEMCIRDSYPCSSSRKYRAIPGAPTARALAPSGPCGIPPCSCLLYTSDAADDM
eukprot:3664494-Alexandrium_andersonii.AAC.1